jgi:hypothetical protein
MGFTYVEVNKVVDDASPLVYMWEIRSHHDEVIYRDVGRSLNGAKRPREDYQRNVANLRDGLPYRASNPDGFREVHRQLYQASLEGFAIRLYLLRNVAAGDDINEVKQSAQALYLSKPFEPVSTL